MKNLLEKYSVKEKPKFGTRELSDTSYNIIKGCMHNCRYCFAANNAAKRKLKNRDDWQNEIVFMSDIIKEPTKFSGVIMFPTNHDITPHNDEVCLSALLRLLETGNQVLVCSKTNLWTAEYFAKNLKKYQEQLTFMVTITSLNDQTSAFWEPNAPMPLERISCLKLYHNEGYQTSVINEPMLDGVGGAIQLYEAVSPYVTNDIWFGLMNFPEDRVDQSDPENVKRLNELKQLHSEANINFLYSVLNGKDKVCWKDSIRKIISRRTDFAALRDLDDERKFMALQRGYPKQSFQCAVAEYPRY